MNKLILVIIFASSIGNAQSIEPLPDYMKGAEIKVELQGGKTHYFNSRDYKVVKRGQKPVKPEVVEKVVTIEVEKPQKKNRITLYGGYGPSSGLKVTDTGENSKNVKAGYESLIGIGYSRKVSEAWSVDGVLSSGLYRNSRNQTGLVGAGYEF